MKKKILDVGKLLAAAVITFALCAFSIVRPLGHISLIFFGKSSRKKVSFKI